MAGHGGVGGGGRHGGERAERGARARHNTPLTRSSSSRFLRSSSSRRRACFTKSKQETRTHGSCCKSMHAKKHTWDTEPHPTSSRFRSASASRCRRRSSSLSRRACTARTKAGIDKLQMMHTSPAHCAHCVHNPNSPQPHAVRTHRPPSLSHIVHPIPTPQMKTCGNV
jgi:hypothetical protein